MSVLFNSGKSFYQSSLVTIGDSICGTEEKDVEEWVNYGDDVCKIGGVETGTSHVAYSLL